MSMWAAGELASCRYCLEQKMEALWTYIISVDQLLAFKMRGKRCCEALCLLKPRPDVQASRLPHSFTCLSSPSSLYSLYPLLSHPSSSSLVPISVISLGGWVGVKRWSLTEVWWLHPPVPSYPSILLHPPPISPCRYSCRGPPAPATPPLSSCG